jgi:hypothetical protein
MSKIDFHFQIHYPLFIEKTVVYFLLRHRKKKYGIAFRKIKLAKGAYTLVDPQDYERLSKHAWHLYESRTKHFYAAAFEAGKIVYMHREITAAPAGKIAHHDDGNGLNNTKSNLEIVTLAENNRYCRKTKKPTSSRFKGVAFIKSRKKWHARIVYNGVCKFLGYFENEDDAARAYDAAAKIYHGKFAVLNFPDEAADEAGKLSRQQLELLRAQCLS